MKYGYSFSVQIGHEDKEYFFVWDNPKGKYFSPQVAGNDGLRSDDDVEMFLNMPLLKETMYRNFKQIQRLPNRFVFSSNLYTDGLEIHRDGLSFYSKRNRFSLNEADVWNLVESGAYKIIDIITDNTAPIGEEETTFESSRIVDENGDNIAGFKAGDVVKLKGLSFDFYVDEDLLLCGVDVENPAVVVDVADYNEEMKHKTTSELDVKTIRRNFGKATMILTF